MLHHTASRNGGSTAPTPPSSARHAPASSPFGAATAAVHASAAGAESSVDRTPPRNPPPSARRPWRVPQQLASVAPAAASLYRQLTSGRWGSGGDGAGGLASWAAFGSSSSSPLHRGGRRSGGGQVFRAVGNSRVARAVRANKRVTAAGLAALAVIVLVSSSSGGFAGRARTRYSRSLVADSDNSSELDAVTLSELTALDAKQGGVGAVAGKAANNNNSPPRRASPTAADLPGTATATPTGLAIEALDRSELSGLVQSTGFFSANEAEAVVDAVSKGDLDTAELLKAIEGEMVKQAQEAERAKAAVQAAEDASKAPATKGKDGGGGIGSAGTADDIDEWFFDDLGDDDFFFDDEDGVGDGGRDEGFGDYFDDEDDDLFGFDDEDEFSSPRGSGGGSGARKGAAGGGRRAGGRASSDSSRATSPRGAATSPRRGGNVLDDDVHDGLGLGTSSSSSRVGSRSRSSGRGSSRPVDLNEDELEEDARLFGDDEGFGDELDDAADAPPRRGGGRQFAEDEFADEEEPDRRGGGGGRKASPATKRSSSSRGGHNGAARRGPALADDFAAVEDANIGDGALFGDEDKGTALFVNEDDGGLNEDEPLFDDDEVVGAGGVGRDKRSKGAAGSSSTTRKNNKKMRPGQKGPLQPEPDFRSGGAKASLAGAARAEGSRRSDLTAASAAAGGGRSNALPTTTTLDSGRPASGSEDLNATAAANPIPRKQTTSDLIATNTDKGVSGSAVDAVSASGNGNIGGGVASAAAAHENFKSQIATANAAVAAQNAKKEHTAVAVASGLAAFEASSNANAIAAAVGGGGEGGGRASSSSSSASTSTATPTKTPPVVVALANRFYFGDRYARVVPECTWRGGASLPCEFTSDQARFADADAIAFHIPGMSKEMLDAAESTRRSEQALVGVSMESAPNYPLLADKDFLAHFDLLATLSPPEEGDGAGSSPPQTPRRVWYPYYDDMFRRCWEAEGNPAAAILSSLSPAEGAAGGAAASAGVTTTANPSKPSLHPSYLRENAIAYVNSNCATKTGRDELVKAMAEVLEPLGIPLRSFGHCLNNMPRSARADTKIDTLRRYKFCVAVENSEMPHYVSEKVFDAFVAGCVPIYFGAPNILDYIPHRDAIIDVRALGGAKQAADEVARLVADDAAHARKHAWRDDPSSWSQGFKKLERQSWRDGAGPFEKCQLTWTVDNFEISDPHMRRQCAICREVAEFQDALV